MGGLFKTYKNHIFSYAKENGLKYVMVCDYSDLDKLYDVNTKKEINISLVFSTLHLAYILASSLIAIINIKGKEMHNFF